MMEVVDREYYEGVIKELKAALRGMVDNFKPFTLKPIGAPGSSARADQDAQIAAHAAAVAALEGRG